MKTNLRFRIYNPILNEYVPEFDDAEYYISREGYLVLDAISDSDAFDYHHSYYDDLVVELGVDKDGKIFYEGDIVSDGNLIKDSLIKHVDGVFRVIGEYSVDLRLVVNLKVTGNIHGNI